MVAASRVPVGPPVLLSSIEWHGIRSAARELDVRAGGHFELRAREMIAVWDQPIQRTLLGFPAWEDGSPAPRPLGLFVAHARGDGRMAVRLELVNNAEPVEDSWRWLERTLGALTETEGENGTARRDRLQWWWQQLRAYAAGDLLGHL